MLSAYDLTRAKSRRAQSCAKDDLPAGWGSEKFVVKEGGEGRVGFYNSGRKQSLG